MFNPSQKFWIGVFDCARPLSCGLKGERRLWGTSLQEDSDFCPNRTFSVSSHIFTSNNNSIAINGPSVNSLLFLLFWVTAAPLWRCRTEITIVLHFHFKALLVTGIFFYYYYYCPTDYEKPSIYVSADLQTEFHLSDGRF